MLHVLKKKTAATTASSRGVCPTAEFTQMKQKLALVKRNLVYTDKKMIDADLMWRKQLAAQRSFSEDFCDGYAPIDGVVDDTQEIMIEFSRGANERYDHFIRASKKEDEAFTKMRKEVAKYVAEVNEVESRYSEIVEAKSEVARYQSKIDSIELRKNVNDPKKTRNLLKLDIEREFYKKLAVEIVDKQKAIYAKASVCHKMALCAYWAAHSKHVDVLSTTMEKTAAWAKNVEVEMVSIDIASLELIDTASEFSKSEASAGEASPTSSVPSPTYTGAEGGKNESPSANTSTSGAGGTSAAPAKPSSPKTEKVAISA
eukprot:Plantae.Rhodophyta-Palmaria_palmata.ctg8571.p1 GENE.Plantae.Rhodophyta-Palmaria_palmata.ctg8571~~Plantae.Rhodophyta-Palmaria_palmata.ctg8571.p1  ORF type:complete len:315 (+),score=87.81 Plantae.Rhodophyta-Palmaria_palmata.ctg8571:141-1085(+)